MPGGDEFVADLTAFEDWIAAHDDQVVDVQWLSIRAPGMRPVKGLVAAAGKQTIKRGQASLGAAVWLLGIDLLQAQDIGFEAFQHRSQNGNPLFEAPFVAMTQVEIFEIPCRDAHGLGSGVQAGKAADGPMAAGVDSLPRRRRTLLRCGQQLG